MLNIIKLVSKLFSFDSIDVLMIRVEVIYKKFLLFKTKKETFNDKSVEIISVRNF